MHFTIISTSAELMHINIEDPLLVRKFCSIFQHANDDSIFKIQQYGEELKNSLAVLVNSFGKKAGCFHGIFAYFTKLKNGEYFAIIPEQINDTQQLIILQSQIDERNGQKNSFDFGINDIITPIYNLSCFGHQRKSIGEPIKTERTCRFCGKSLPEVTFSKKSHAISEALGNKNVICLEECDCCNEYFGKTIERDIVNMLSLYRSIYNIKGKEGIPTSKGKMFEVSEKLFSVVLPIHELSEIKDKTFILDTSEQKYIPQNVYRCLCKYVLSVVDRKLLSDFTDAISWISNRKTLNYFPLLGFWDNSLIIQEPHLYIFHKKNTDNKYPLLAGGFFIGAIGIFFIIPNNSCDISQQSESFFDLLKKIPTYENMVKKDFSSTTSDYAQFTLSFN